MAYPFGYGMSYTSYDISDMNVSYNAADDTYTVTVKVTNTGDMAGKKTVQVYVQSPYTDYDKQNNVEKSSIQLLGYAFWFYENHDRNTVRLHVSENNARAIAFYRRSGFVQLGRDPGVRERLLLMGRLIHRTVTHGSV